MRNEVTRTIATTVVSSILCVGFLYLLFREEQEEPVRNDIPTEGGLGSSKGEREQFIPTAEWQSVEDHHICPAGLEYRLDMTTGSKLARIPQ